MILRNYYYEIFGGKFADLEKFISLFGKDYDFQDFLHFQRNSINIDDYKLPLYDYVFSCISLNIGNNSLQGYNTDSFSSIVDKDFLLFLLSQHGIAFIQNELLVNESGENISIYDDAKKSQDNFNSFSYNPHILDIKNFSFIDQFCNYPTFDYIKKVKILSLFRKFIEYKGTAQALNNIQDEFLYNLWCIIKDGIFVPSDQSNYFSNVMYFDELMDLNYGS